MHSDGSSARCRRGPTCPRDDQAPSELAESRPAAESRATHAAEGLVAAAKDAAARSAALGRSCAATATGGLTVARTAAVDALQGVADKGAAVVRSGAAGVAASLAATSAAAVPRLRSGSEAATAALRSGGAGVAAGVAVGFSTAHGALTGFAENLDWSTIDPTKYLYAGTRGIYRGLEEARLVWESIPERLRALGPEEVGKRLEDFDWSHIVPHSQGGGNEASNGIFELAGSGPGRSAASTPASPPGGARTRPCPPTWAALHDQGWAPAARRRRVPRRALPAPPPASGARPGNGGGPSPGGLPADRRASWVAMRGEVQRRGDPRLHRLLASSGRSQGWSPRRTSHSTPTCCVTSARSRWKERRHRRTLHCAASARRGPRRAPH